MQLLSKLEYDYTKIGLYLFDIDALGSEDSELREPLFNKVKKEIIVLQNAQREVLFDVLSDHKKMADLLRDIESEQQDIIRYIQRLSQMPTDEERWFELFTEFKNFVFSHIEKEQKKLFPKIHTILKDDDQQLYQQLYDHKSNQRNVGINIGVIDLSGHFFQNVKYAA